jgi:hypothetical protein
MSKPADPNCARCRGKGFYYFQLKATTCACRYQQNLDKNDMDLEQLLETCGEGFTLRKLGKNMWQACGDNECFVSGEGKTPREAVEVLYRAIQATKAD